MRKATSRYSILDRTLDVTTNDPWCAELLASGYAPMRVEGKGLASHTASLLRESCGQLHLRVDTVEIPYTRANDDEPFHTASSAVETMFARLAARVNGHLAVRATAVASSDGAVLIVGPRGIGTSTLALHLVHLGAEFLGDDIALLDLSSRTVLAMPRRPRLREQAIRYVPTRELRDTISAAPHVYRSRLGRAWYALRPEDLAGIAPSQSARRVRAVAIVECRNADRPSVTRVGTADALCAILAHTLADWQTLSHLSNLRRVIDDASCFGLAMAAPAESARLLTKALITRA